MTKIQEETEIVGVLCGLFYAQRDTHPGYNGEQLADCVVTAYPVFLGSISDNWDNFTQAKASPGGRTIANMIMAAYRNR